MVSDTEKLLILLTLAMWTMSFIQYNKLKRTQAEHEQELIDNLVVVFNKGTNSDDKVIKLKKFIIEHSNGRYND